MRIVIVGDGKVGYTLAEMLSQEKHDVVIIDSDSQVLRNASDALDVICVTGNGASSRVQLEAGVQEADVLVAATSSDEINMVSCLVAKKLGAKHTIARIRNPEYSSDLKMLQEELGLSMVINPEQTAADEIARLLRFPAAANIDTFVRGRVELVEFRLLPEDDIVGLQLRSLPKKYADNILICAVERDDEVIIPGGQFELQVDDMLHIIGNTESVTRFFKQLGRYTAKLKDILIIGGGRISYYLAKYIESAGMQLRIVEINPARASTLSELLPHSLIICGDGTEQELLDSEGLETADAFVALTDRDEENIITAMYAMRKGVPKVIAKLNRTNYLDIIGDMGIDSVVSAKLLTADHILHYVRAMENSRDWEIETLYRIVDGKAEAMEFASARGFEQCGVPISQLELKKNLLIAVIVRDGKVIIPRGWDMIQKNDRVIVVTTDPTLREINHILRK